MPLLALQLLGGGGVSRAASVKDVVFDVDWTLASEVEPLHSDPAHTIVVEGKSFRIADGAEEIMTRLAHDGRVRISFFSGGDANRNLTLLKEIRLTDGSGRSFYDIAYKVLSKDDMTVVSADPALKFTDRFKKDLQKISPDLNDIVLVDDVRHFTAPGQEKNVLWLKKTYSHFETYEDAVSARKRGQDLQYIPKTRERWFYERKKLYGVFEIILGALNESEESGRAFSTIVWDKSQRSRNPFIELGLASAEGKPYLSCLARGLGL